MDLAILQMSLLNFIQPLPFLSKHVRLSVMDCPETPMPFLKIVLELKVLIYLQMTISMMFNAFLFSFFFTRLAKSESRAVQVVFSDKIVVRVTERGTIVWQARVYDVDQGHGIVEAHVRMYALLKHKDADGHPQLVQLRIVSPNDDLGGVLFLNIPTVVTHEMDYYSPLYPSYKDPAARKYRLSSGGLLLREVDSITGSREEIFCPVCGESYGDFRRLRMHIKYNQMVEKKDDYPLEGSHRELKLEGDKDDEEEDVIPKSTPRPSLEEAKVQTSVARTHCRGGRH